MKFIKLTLASLLFSLSIFATDTTSLETPFVNTPSLTSSLNTTIANPDSSELGLEDGTDTANEKIEVEGLIIDSATGEAVANNPTVVVGTDTLLANSDGEFAIEIEDTSHISFFVTAKGYGTFSKELQFDTNNKFYFITVQLSKSRVINEVKDSAKVQFITKGLPWKLTGSITNSRTDEALQDTSAKLYFDDSLIVIGRRGSFKGGRYKIVTTVGGEHELKLTIDGYHPVYEKILFTEEGKDIYYNISTTEKEFDNVRREMVVTAKAEPIHKTSSSAKITLTRKTLQRTSATMTDPLRVLQTLPGVASQSDASARPIVRGGDPLESRVFVDGIPLIQPFHFGGARSIFNQSQIENLTLYKSGFPSRYHDAQSAIITVDTRDPITEKVTSSGDINLMQYNAYVGIPIVKNKLGMYLASQGSYTNAMFKAGWAAFSRFSSDNRSYFKDNAKYLNLPDYQDFSGGFKWNISQRLSLTVNESFNTDRFNYLMADSLFKMEYSYEDIYHDTINDSYYHNPTGYAYIDNNLVLKDTTIMTEISKFREIDKPDKWDISRAQPLRFEDPIYDNENNYSYNRKDYNSYKNNGLSTSVDTIIDYKSRYSLLHSNLSFTKDEDNHIDFKLAWQKRWWNLNFPENFTSNIDTTIYDVNINQINAIADWTNSYFKKHTINSGIQLDLTISDYNVYTPRPIHEIITKGNTNFGDFWGPLTGDTGVSLIPSESAYNEYGYSEYEEYDGAFDMVNRLLFAYQGEKNYLNGSLFFEDDWEVNERWRVTAGARLEVSSLDTSVAFSPRVISNFEINKKSEFVASAGLYTQNNYDAAVIALSEVLKPEKVVHGDLGYELQILPWLTQKVNLYGKYYFDLASERIEQMDPTDIEGMLYDLADQVEDIEDLDLIELEEMFNAYMLNNRQSIYQSKYTNSGRGYAYGLEWLLQYNPKDYWEGWISLTLQESMRQRHPGWKWYRYSISRPFMISWVNYYRLPRKYEVGFKYRYMSGVPYTETDFDYGTIGPYNAKQYMAYNRLDLKISKGFTRKMLRKLHIYLEVWNSFNTPNLFLRDSETEEMQSIGWDLPTTAIFLGLDWNF